MFIDMSSPAVLSFQRPVVVGGMVGMHANG